jgi:hypothetical protein
VLAAKDAFVAKDRVFEDWNISYHGTSLEALSSIVDHRMELLMSGDQLRDGRKLDVVPGHLTKRHKAEYLYTSPSILYCESSVYAKETDALPDGSRAKVRLQQSLLGVLTQLIIGYPCCATKAGLVRSGS